MDFCVDDVMMSVMISRAVVYVSLSQLRVPILPLCEEFARCVIGLMI